MKRTFLGRSIEQIQLAKDLRNLKKAKQPLAALAARKHLAERMGKMRGLPQKMGQLLAMSNTEGEDPFRDLADSAEPIPLDQFKEVVTQAWGTPWSTHLATIDPKGLAASLGQVHKAVLHDGTTVAVKAAYPGIRDAMTNDLKMLGWLGKGAETVRSDFDFQAYQNVLLEDLEEELDYRQEMENQKTFSAKLTRSDGVVIPRVFEELTCDNVLVSEWVDGVSIEDAAQWDLATREALGQRLVRFFLKSLFQKGLLHADPHPGNYRFRKTSAGPEIVLYDFGSVSKFTRKERLFLMRTIQNTTQPREDFLPLLIALGFKEDLIQPIHTKLAALCHVLFEPFRVPGKFDSSKWARSERIADILGEDRWNFRMSGPPSYIFLVRGFQGVLYYLEKLGVSTSWSRLLQPLLDMSFAEFMVQPLPKLKYQDRQIQKLAKNLRIRLTQDGEQKVALKFPVDAVENLEDLVGEEILQKLRDRNIDCTHLIKKARTSGYAPCELFELSDGAKCVKVWLE